MNKIFGIGLNRTATLSLTKALTILGYRTWHYPPILDIQNNILSLKKDPIERVDALTDTPVTRFYKELDVLYPNSKFILTIREMDSWLESCKFYFTPDRFDDLRWIKLNYDIYDCKDFNRDKFEKTYRNHLKDVKSYFRNRKQDLLIIDICKGEGWDKLCAFLNRKIPNKPFPHLHKKNNRSVFIRNLFEKGREYYDKIKFSFF